ncbi:hypothetical protein O1R50_08920 [Glycomyces luteolus]|uniref:Uncharacterized protein n=1 Tax=Glycomyces luteolus TaxID=2670330 RepID=A0A9X3SPT9_9ACTN|nr:hypothetical protein [Glycomyces luteolus]MDA1359742.1 hypothetical protein [Glycomyces luteolus]
MNGTKSAEAWACIDANSEQGPSIVDGFSNFKRQLPPEDASVAEGGRVYRAVDIRDYQTDADDLAERVGAPRIGLVSCCLCQAQLKVPCMGYGDLVRRAEAAGWRYRPARCDRARVWCPRCQHDAGSAA